MKKILLLSIMLIAIALTHQSCLEGCERGCAPPQGAIEECEGSGGTWNDAYCECQF